MAHKIYHPTLQDIIKESGPLNPAETDFVACCKTGEMLMLGNEVPTESTPQNIIRASLIRHMLLGGCEDMPVGPKGGVVQGAWITAVLDLKGCESRLDLYLDMCKFTKTPVLRDARLGAVYLPGCHLPGLYAHRLTVVRDILLNQGFRSSGTVNLSASRIGQTLDCVGGHFDGAGGAALDCNGITVGASVFLHDGFQAMGQVNLVGAQITGPLDCTGGHFDGAGGTALQCDAITVGADVFLRGGFQVKGQVNLMRAQVAGHLQCMRGKFNGVLNCEGMTVAGGFFWQGVQQRPDLLDLTDASVGSLRDDKGSWQDKKGRWQGCVPVLHGFRYDRIIGDMSVGQRLKWLARGWEPGIEPSLQLEWNDLKGATAFDPQPYSQLAKTLRAQGNRGGAARVLTVRGQRQAKAAYYSAQAAVDGSATAGWAAFVAILRRPVDAMFGGVFGYGHQPARALFAVLAIWLFSVALYGTTYDRGQMAPNSPVILTSADWQAAANRGCAKEKQPDCTMPLRLWEASNTSTDYETFNRYLYALDLFVPLDALGQETAWAPSKDRGALGWCAYSLRWLIQLLGWVITAIGAAAVTGVIGKRD